MLAALGSVTFVFAVLRFVVPVAGRVERRDIYKDLAHIWVGLLIGLAFANPEVWALAIGLTVVELIAFVARKKR